MNGITRTVVGLAASLLLAAVPAIAHHPAAHPAAASPAVTASSAPAGAAPATSGTRVVPTLTGCVTTTIDTEPHFGWFYRMYHTVCSAPAVPPRDCLTVVRIPSPYDGRAEQTLMTEQCTYGSF